MPEFFAVNGVARHGRDGCLGMRNRQDSFFLLGTYLAYQEHAGSPFDDRNEPFEREEGEEGEVMKILPLMRVSIAFAGVLFGAGPLWH